MKIIRPTAITNAMLTSSTVPETDYAAWAAGTAYTAGNRVIRTTTHSIYQRVVSGTTATAPESDTVNWVRVGPTNRWAMFDQSVGSATTAATSITVVIAAGRVNSLALLGVDAATVDIALVANATTVYTGSMDLTNGNTVGNWYQYFYEPIYQQDSVVITDLMDASLMDLPAYGDGVLTITLTRTGGNVALGGLIVGLYADLGDTLYQPKIGITDYSKKEIDAFGNATVTVRAYSKRMTANVSVPNTAADNVARVLSQYRSTPLVWLASGNLYTSLIVYGFCKDWGITIDNFTRSTLNLDVEGLA